MRAHSLESLCRWDTRDAVGNVGVEYEFEIKIPTISGVDCTNAEFEDLASQFIADFKRTLKSRYTWVGDVYTSGRSGGWLTVVDKKGLATREKLKTIIGLVEKGKRAFVKELKYQYPA